MIHAQAMRKMVELIREHVPEQPDGKRAAERAISHLDRLATSTAALESLASKPNPVQTEAAHVKAVSGSYAELQSLAQRVSNDAQQALREGLSTLDQVSRKKAGLIPNEFASELRAGLRAMSTDNRKEALLQALENGNGDIIAAATQGSGLLVGLPDNALSNYREVFLAKHAPAEVEARNKLLEMLSNTAAIVGVVNRARDDFTNADRLRKITESEKAAQAASSAFQESLGAGAR